VTRAIRFTPCTCPSLASAGAAQDRHVRVEFAVWPAATAADAVLS
jgi:hypothetical protein